jgi:DNA (cytosine-5)-methyltransferase 1
MPGVLAASTDDISHCLNAGGMGRQDYETETLIAHTLKGEGFDAGEDGTGRGTPLVPVAYGFNWQNGGGYGNANDGLGITEEGTGPLQRCNTPAVATNMAVRRLTPVECERLQGFPDGYTNIPWRGKPEAPDGPRYKALGNSMAVPCMAFIGRRIASELARASQSQEKAA